MPLSDAQFLALIPFIEPHSPRGRQIGDLRLRLDAIFHIAATPDPWSALPERFGNPDTVARYFRRLAHRGAWEHMLITLAGDGASPHLRAIAPLIFRACRRAYRLLGLPFITLIRRLNLLQALPGPPRMVPNPILSETIASRPFHLPSLASRLGRALLQAEIALRKRLHREAGGHARIPRSLRLAWS
ncbi:transposase [Acetobacteraceae bacterium H6797]|nr:transposase [Acetobacteraceae bacterium H6797]